jgi:hypothetical protein
MNPLHEGNTKSKLYVAHDKKPKYAPPSPSDSAQEDIYILACAIKTLAHFKIPHESYVLLTSDGHSCIANCKDADYMKPFLGMSINTVAQYVAYKLRKSTKYVKD